jgi:shikimate kinase
MNIILIGLMGTGKTTIGKILSKKYSMQFVDTDDLIEKQQKVEIKEIFKAHGESFFRKLEAELLTELERKDNLIISTGGGLPIFNNNIEKLLLIGNCIWLEAGKKTIIRNVGNDSNRPILNNPDREKTIEKLLNERNIIYEKAHFKINVDEKTVEQIVSEIDKIFFGSR